MIKLKEIFKITEGKYSEGSLETSVADIEYDSKCIFPNTVFVAIKGENFDGNLFIPEAIQKGANALILSQEFYENRENIYKDIFIKIKKKAIPYIIVKDTEKAVSQASALIYNYPSQKLSLIGITGTNGKTSITYILEKIFSYNHDSVGIIGSTLYRYPEKTIKDIEYTTPKSLFLERLISQMKDANVKYVALEASSHGIKMNRVTDLDFETAIFTNLSREHMDYHKTIEDYFETKKRLFTETLKNSKKTNKHAIINIDDEYGKKLYNTIKHISEFKTITYGFSLDCDYRITKYSIEEDYSLFTIENNNKTYSFKINLTGKHNIYNTLAAISTAIEVYKLPYQNIKNALLDKNFVIPGRLEKLESYNIFIDYAHTDDALLNVLNALKETFPHKKIITIFGAGGDRDKGKRPKMGSVVSEFTDYAIVTSDNPRTEPPQNIIDSIVAGMKHKNYKIIIDREEAIKEAIKNFNPLEDVLLIAGKGHETYQIIGTEKIHFDDKEIAKRYIETLNTENTHNIT